MEIDIRGAFAKSSAAERRRAPRSRVVETGIVASVKVLVLAGMGLLLSSCSDGPSPSRLARMADSARAAAKADSARPRTSAASLLRDSAAADSAALSNLPARIREDFDIAELFSARALQDSSRAYCQPLSDSSSREVRKRLRGKVDGRVAVLFARADRASGVLNRVELVRRPAAGGQRGYIWDRAEDVTKSVEWKPGGGTPETYGLPEGTPAPRALRALGRRLIVLPCTGVRARPE